MTPEENFARLRDESLWNDIRIPRGVATRHAALRFWSFAVPALSALVVAAVVVTSVVVSRGTSDQGPVVADPAPSHSSTSQPSTTPEPPTPTKTPPAPTAVSPASPLFDGNCENVLPQSKVNDIAGTTMSNDPALLDLVMGEYDGDLWSAPGFVTRQIGGLSCAWYSEADQTLFNFTFMPADRVTPPDDPGTCVRPANGWDGCITELVKNGVQVRAMVGQTGGPEDARKTEALLKLAKRAISRLDNVVGHVQGPDDWPLPVDCKTLSSQAGLGEVVSGGTDSSASSDDKYAELLDDGGRLECGYESGNALYRPGGAWAEHTIAALPGAEEIDVDGFDSVIVVEHEGYTIYNFFRGSNWLYVDQKPTKKSDIIRFATKVADGLDDLRP